MRRLWFAAALSVVVATAVTGCGGGGGSSAGNSRVAVFATDSFRDDYDHVWATVYKVELLTSTGAVTILTDTAGRTVDLKTLRDGTGPRYILLGDVQVPVGTYTGIRATIAPTLSLVPTGATTGVATPVDDSLPRDTSGNVPVAYNFPTPLVVTSATTSVAIDFDLANFSIVGGKCRPSLKHSDKSGLERPERHEREDYGGTVGDLSGTAPTQTFTLSRGAAGSITVVTNSSTVLFKRSAATNPALANGQRVEVLGSFDIATRTLTAVAIKIEDNATPGVDSPEAKGPVTNIRANTNLFTLRPIRARGFRPATATIEVVTSDTTVFRADRGLTLTKDEFYTRLAAAARAEVEGSYDANTNTFTATRAKLEDEPGGGGGGGVAQAEARGTATNVNADAGTLVLNPVQEYEGFQYGGGSITVSTTANTKFKNAAGNLVDKATFFAAVVGGGVAVQAEGTYSGATLTALELKIRI